MHLFTNNALMSHLKFRITCVTHESEILLMLNLLASLTKLNIDYTNRRMVEGDNSLLPKY